jgi:fructose/tagatose bisphosphate aldolase
MKSSNCRWYCRRKTHSYSLAEAYGATVILHTDHCAKNYYLIDGLLDASEEHFAAQESRYTALI